MNEGPKAPTDASSNAAGPARLRLVPGLVVAVAALVLVWWWFSNQDPSNTTAPPLGTADTAVVLAAASTAATVATPASGPLQPMSPAGTVRDIPDECKAMTDAEGLDGQSPVDLQASADQLQNAMTRQLLAGGNAQAQATGWMLDAARNFGPSPRPSGQESASLLAAAAQSSPDPMTYAWALQACSMANVAGPKSAACAALSNQRWAELAPGLVWPWLALAGEAQRAGDLSGFENAMHHASQATDWRNPGRDFQIQLLGQVPAQASDSDRAIALLPGLNLLVNFSMQLASMAVYCPLQQDANRNQSCRRISEQAMIHADNMLELGLGLAVAERSGVDETHLAKPRDERAAASRASALPAAPPGQPEVLCSAITRSFSRLTRVSEVGELQALREEATRLPQ